MKQVLKIDRAVNYHITKSIITLHEEGYIYDFLLNGVDQLWDVQENRSYPFNEININKIGKFDEQDGKTAKFIIAIETTDGSKGLLLSTNLNGDFLNQIRKGRLADDVQTEMLQ